MNLSSNALRMQDTEALYRSHAHVVFGPDILLSPRIGRFFEDLCAVAPAIQQEKYPGNEDYFVHVPGSAISEIAAFSKLRTPSPEQVAMVTLARARLRKLHELGVLRITQDPGESRFSDSTLLYSAFAGRRRLFVTNDTALACDLQAAPNTVRFVDMRGFLVSETDSGDADESGVPAGTGGVGKGSVLYSACGPIVLGDEIDGGCKDFRFFAVNGCAKLCAKVFTDPESQDPLNPPRVEVLCTDKFQLDAAAQPVSGLYTADGRFQGFAMMFICEALPLDVLFGKHM